MPIKGNGTGVRFGTCKGEFEIGADIDACNTEIEAMFYGNARLERPSCQGKTLKYPRRNAGIAGYPYRALAADRQPQIVGKSPRTHHWRGRSGVRQRDERLGNID